MTVFFHEIKRGRTALTIWTAALAFMLGVCVFIYPEMAGDMEELSSMFADMGSFSSAFGLDRLNFGEFMGFFGVECGNTLGIGGTIFAAVLGISALANEERDRTAEWLLTHPVSRARVVVQKLAAVMVQVLVFNAVIAAVTAGAIVAIGEQVAGVEIALIFAAYTLMQLCVAALAFGVSAFLRRGGMAIGIGGAFGLYFLNILANLTEDAKPLKYLTPLSFADSAYIMDHHALDGAYVAVSAVIAVTVLTAGTVYYLKKDIS